ncbi:Uncharacterised protein [Turicibacter sanguinis]|nr:Uncharacterised protein [Turicibacter sanguinis]
MKKMSIKLISRLVIFTMCFGIPLNTDAKTMPVEIQQVFTEADGEWYPGRIESNDFIITNNGTKGIKVDRLSIRLTSSKNYQTSVDLTQNSSEFKEISQNSIVTLRHEDTVLFKKNMSQLLEEEWTLLDEMISIKSNSNAVLNMTIDTSKEKVTNNPQAIESIFSISLTYKEDENIIVDSIGESKPNNDKLPETGVNSITLMFLGVLAIGTGLVIENKSASRKGGKDDV